VKKGKPKPKPKPKRKPPTNTSRRPPRTKLKPKPHRKPPVVRKPKAPKHPTEPDDDMPVPVDDEPVAEQEQVEPGPELEPEPVPDAEVPTAPDQQTAPQVTPFSPTTDSNHKNSVTAAASSLQIALKSATTQAAADAACIAYFQACRTSAIANGFSPSVFTAALHDLGTGGQ
jgi:hypothetical protein